MAASASLVPLQTLQQALQVAEIRNASRTFMTNFSGEIAPEEQTVWFAECYLPQNPRNYFLWLLVEDKSEKVIGYGALRKTPEGCLVTEALSPEFRGRGFGKILLNQLLTMPGFEGIDIVADIFIDNEASIRLHSGLGFRLEGAVGDRVHRYRLVR